MRCLPRGGQIDSDQREVFASWWSDRQLAQKEALNSKRNLFMTHLTRQQASVSSSHHRLFSAVEVSYGSATPAETARNAQKVGLGDI